MQVEKINENTIRVHMDSEELKSRGIRMLDLLGNKSEIQDFFYSILREVDTDHSFAGDNQPVTFQVMPNEGGLDLLITKYNKADADNIQKQLGNLLGMGNDNRESRLEPIQKLNKELGISSDSNKDIPAKEVSNQANFLFSDIDQVVQLADSLPTDKVAASLYTFKEHYLLQMNNLGNDEDVDSGSVWSVCLELGTLADDKTLNLFKNNGKCLIKQDALADLLTYFK